MQSFGSGLQKMHSAYDLNNTRLCTWEGSKSKYIPEQLMNWCAYIISSIFIKINNSVPKTKHEIITRDILMMNQKCFVGNLQTLFWNALFCEKSWRVHKNNDLHTYTEGCLPNFCKECGKSFWKKIPVGTIMNVKCRSNPLRLSTLDMNTIDTNSNTE